MDDNQAKITELELIRQQIIESMANYDLKIGEIEAQLRESAVGFHETGLRDSAKWRLNAEIALKITKRERMVAQNKLGPINRELKTLRVTVNSGNDWLKLPPDHASAVFGVLRAAEKYASQHSRESEVLLLDALDHLDKALPGWRGMEASNG